MKLIKLPLYNKEVGKSLPTAINAEEIESIKIITGDTKKIFGFETTMKSGRKIKSEILVDPNGEKSDFKEIINWLDNLIETINK